MAAKFLELVTIAALIGLVVLHADQVAPAITTTVKIFTNAAKTAAQ